METLTLPPPAPLPVLAAIMAGVYVLWLHVGTRSNPPASNPPEAYEDFNSGVTFPAVRQMLKHEQDAAYESGQYMFVSRSTVLGRMHQLKQEQYARYLDLYDEGDEPSSGPGEGGLPF